MPPIRQGKEDAIKKLQNLFDFEALLYGSFFHNELKKLTLERSANLITSTYMQQ